MKNSFNFENYFRIFKIIGTKKSKTQASNLVLKQFTFLIRKTIKELDSFASHVMQLDPKD